MKKLWILSLLAALALGAASTYTLNYVAMKTATGSGGAPRIDFFEPGNVFSTHFSASPTLAANNNFILPKNTTTTAAAGNCLTLLGTASGATEWDPCGGTSPPVSWSLSSASDVLTLANPGGGKALNIVSGPVALGTGALTGTHAQNLGTGDNPTFVIVIATSGVIAGGITATTTGISSTGGASFDTSGASTFHVGTTSSTIGATFSDTGGTCRISFAGGGVTCPSDVRLKKNILPMESSIDRLMRLRPVAFDWRESGQHADGLIAQEVQKIFPLAVHRGEDKDGTLHVSYQQLMPYVVKAMQEQQSQIVRLQADIATLKGHK